MLKKRGANINLNMLFESMNTEIDQGFQLIQVREFYFCYCCSWISHYKTFYKRTLN